MCLPVPLGSGFLFSIIRGEVASGIGLLYSRGIGVKFSGKGKEAGTGSTLGEKTVVIGASIIGFSSSSCTFSITFFSS